MTTVVPSNLGHSVKSDRSPPQAEEGAAEMSKELTTTTIPLSCEGAGGREELRPGRKEGKVCLSFGCTILVQCDW